MCKLSLFTGSEAEKYHYLSCCYCYGMFTLHSNGSETGTGDATGDGTKTIGNETVSSGIQQWSPHTQSLI